MANYLTRAQLARSILGAASAMVARDGGEHGGALSRCSSSRRVIGRLAEEWRNDRDLRCSSYLH